MKEATPEKTVDAAKKQRSAAYPSITVEQAVEYSKLLLDAYRRNPFSREDAVKAMGFNKITGDSAQKIAALGHYGLVERDGSAYKNSNLAENILHYESEEDRAELIKTVAQKPKLFRALISGLEGQALPSRLGSILIRNHDINPNVAEKVAETFKKSLEFSGLAKNGIVSGTFSTEVDEEGQENGDVPNAPAAPIQARTGAVPPRGAQPPARTGMQSVMLPSGLEISFPSEMAFLFITGVFAAEIASLDAKVAEAMKKPEQSAATNTPDDEGIATD